MLAPPSHVGRDDEILAKNKVTRIVLENTPYTYEAPVAKKTGSAGAHLNENLVDRCLFWRVGSCTRIALCKTIILIIKAYELRTGNFFFVHISSFLISRLDNLKKIPVLRHVFRHLQMFLLYNTIN